jgi:hypothetical protein
MITGDFGALRAWGKDLEGLSEVAPRVRESAAARIKPAMDRYFAPGMGNGWAPHLTVTVQGEEVVVDSGGPARCPEGIPEDVVAQGFDEAFAEVTP